MNNPITANTMGKSKLKIPEICEQCESPFEAKTEINAFAEPTALINKKETTKSNPDRV
ncbi:hypothetical protein KEM09_06670 [Carboxylicivirga mesophila]|uniref:Uncharacterized protein n=1 Tax=Carboxylicivirga mesophila TaxID=1166478 RepID=A0ABS5K801_9BACT|nr:hypothetical protein [Carboxylicivirga mesophila]